MRRIVTDVAVIGAGPAGLSAALAAARAGARVELLDAGAAPGGQYWMRDLDPERRGRGQSAEGLAAAAQARDAGIGMHLGAEVWGVFPDLRICATGPDGPIELAPRALVIATGAQDRVMPFPGWTLAGVMAPGAGQRLAKLGGVAAGRRIVLAGSGPFLAAVAATLGRLGAAPAVLVEARRPDLAVAGHLARFPERWREAVGLVRALAAIPQRRFGWMVTHALGQDRLEAVRIAPIGADGRLDRSRSELVPDVDALLVGWGFRPSIEISSLLRCRHRHDEATGGWFCAVDPDTGATSVPGVFAAGEVTGIAGSLPARYSGRLAGLGAAAFLGLSVPSQDRRATIVRLGRARAFAAGLNRLFEPPAAVLEAVEDSCIVCRCEEVSRAEIAEAYRDGTAGVQGAKLWARAGMGRCQGRVCGWAVARLWAEATGQDPAGAGFNRPRLPIRPVPLSEALAALQPEEPGQVAGAPSRAP
ncbi:FAD/NAD(P)-dependent oxidoreductase [Labrys wisconsinensis]|uniref:NADPH-dependent 2,4-dienoyl-CoA reductase/sulfur reductase-like enzyme n=1 Tax=Labrys wisconsinensis TaxID=425677 RepID=A0ABU0J375_9HYPH|nr:NAD(P)/FAD-dependent oxidoreductase [Labrys wisconsinensis]MDQ0468716.1 NADPH-dependent 2,4-dienoyl-CoA reductase/sulfur reductase-like enzyme [Labrys wisconsinensis]